MNGTDRTKTIAYLASNRAVLEQLSIKPLANKVFADTGIDAPESTLGRLRADLGWVTLRRKSEDLKVRIAKLEEVVAHIVKVHIVILPDHLK